MLIDVRNLRDGQPCAILGLGRTVLPDTCRFDNARFVTECLTDFGRAALLHDLDLDPQTPMTEVVRLADEKFVQATGIRSRYIFPGTTAELGALAARNCLEQAGIPAAEVDAIIVGTNTGLGYPSTADVIKGLIGAPSSAFACDVQEACSVGALIVQLGWEKVRSGNFRRVLVIGDEKATTLASHDDYRTSNLFGDAAFAMLLGPADEDQFVFFLSGSDPTEGRANFIVRTASGFQQHGPAVHKYVGQSVPRVLVEAFHQLGLNPDRVDHFFPHQPSVKTLDFLLANLQRYWPSFEAHVHHNLIEMGNTSGACTGWMIARAHEQHLLEPGQFCLVCTFGAGMSWAVYGFIVR